MSAARGLSAKGRRRRWPSVTKGKLGGVLQRPVGSGRAWTFLWANAIAALMFSFSGSLGRSALILVCTTGLSIVGCTAKKKETPEARSPAATAATPSPASDSRADPPVEESSDPEDQLAQLEVKLASAMATPESTPGFDLLMTAGLALGKGNVADAAFLYYVGRLRVRFDNDLFPPTGTGGDSPMVAFSAMVATLGPPINQEIMRTPDELERVVQRVAEWQPIAPDGYEPEWEYEKRGDLEQCLDTHRSRKDEFEKGMGGIARLLKNPDYFDAFELVQRHNTTFTKKDAEYEAAVAVMKRIETELGIDGFAASTKP